MPISLSNLSQILIFKAKMMAGKHKKKLIFAFVFLIVAYIAKKKLTIAHVLAFVSGITKLIQALPLPEDPKLRRIADYEHPPTIPLKSIIQAIRLDEIRKKIARKQAGWEELKQSIVSGVVLTMTLYNAHSLYFLIQNKYHQEFMELESSTQFEQAMYILRKRFTQEIPHLIQNIIQSHFSELERIELNRQYDVEDLGSIFTRLVDKVYENKYDIRKEGNYTVIDRVMPSIKNMFISPYEYVEKRSSWLGKIGGSVLQLAGGIFSISGLLPQAKVEITAQRYLFTKMAYLQPLKKAASELEQSSGIAWPNNESKQLFNLVLEELQFTITSLNFSTVIRAYSNYNLKIMQNRLNLLYQAKKRNSFKFSQLLPLLYKVIQEEFLKPNQLDLRQKYHNQKLKKALLISSIQESQIQEGQKEEPKSIQQHILDQIKLKNAFEFLEKQLQLKIYNERSGFVMRPKGSSGEKDAEEMKRLLGMMSSNQMFSNTEQ